MTPIQFKMVDLDGIDLVEIDGTAVPGIYNKILGAYNTCRVAILCNWFFAGILLPPAHVLITMDDNVLMINDVISIDNDDIVSIPSLAPPVILSELSVYENGEYVPELGVDGFSKVDVEVPGPVLVQLTATENDTYTPGTGEDGFSQVVVNVPQQEPVIQSLNVTQNGTYNVGSGVNGFNPVTVNVPSRITPDDSTIGYLYINVNGNCMWGYQNIEGMAYYHLLPGTYVCCLGSQVSTRYRVQFYENLSYSDFEDYIHVSGPGTALYQSSQIIANNDNNLEFRVVFTVQNEGELIIMYSNNSTSVDTYVFKIS